jgi:hypothetical protein
MKRRTFLRAAGVSLALPWLEALAREPRAPRPRRMLCVCSPLGLHTANLVPEKAGRDYAPTPYLEIFKEVREDLTVISGLSHPEIAEGHDSWYSFLTGAHHRGFMRSGFRNTISLDQLAAERIGGETRYASLALTSEGLGLSWTRSGVLIPSSFHPSAVFAQLFLEGGPGEVEAQLRRLRRGQSILDNVRDPNRELQPALGVSDREKLDEYYTSIRELEKRLAISREWARKPKPKVDAKPPQNPSSADIVGAARTWFDVIHLAFQTDSTRLITLMLSGSSSAPPIPGVSLGHHDLSHHGQDPAKLGQLKIVETETMKALRDFLLKLKGAKEEDATLLDRTMVFFGSNLGNASSHSTKNLPVLFAGGGFKHGQHLAFDPAGSPPPLCNLFVSMLHRLGIEAEKFGSSTGTLPGLDERP